MIPLQIVGQAIEERLGEEREKVSERDRQRQKERKCADYLLFSSQTNMTI